MYKRYVPHVADRLFGKGRWKRLGKEKYLYEIVIEALVFCYTRPEFPCFENRWYSALSSVTNGSGEIVGSRWYMRKGNRAPKLLSPFCFSKKKKILLCLTFPHYFVLEKKNCLIRPCPFATSNHSHTSSKTRLLPPNSKLLSLATFSALLQHFLLSWNLSVTWCHTVKQ